MAKENHGMNKGRKAKVRFRMPTLFTFSAQFLENADSNMKSFVELVDNTNESIRILSGEVNENFYCNPDVKSALQRAAKNGRIIELAFGPNINKKSLNTIQKLKENRKNVTLYMLPKRPEVHYMIFDDKTVKLQHKHPEETTEHRSVVKRNVKRVADAFNDDFRMLVKSSLRKL